MLSLIICSRNSDIPQSLKDNIANTIGEEYELVVINNSTNKFSIFSAYNEGVQRANGDLLCFMHEDILFKTENWGKNVVTHFQSDPTTGLIGAFGGHYLSKSVSHVGDSNLLSGQYIYSKDGVNYILEDYNDFWGHDNSADVVAVDGMWFVIYKDLFNYISFDESYKGFHFYDMDICMQINSQNKKCKVVSDVLMVHNTGCNINDVFIQNSYHFYDKWKEYLPIQRGIVIDEKYLKSIDLLCITQRYVRELEYELKNIKKTRLYYLLVLIRKIKQKCNFF